MYDEYPRDHEVLKEVWNEIVEQPPFRAAADREMDYCDGNQLDSVTLQAQRDLGIPSATENVMGPTMIDIEGMEAKHRTDWLCRPDDDDDPEADNIAKATSYKLNQAEKRSGADRALTKMYASLNRVGLGFVEVSREPNPFKFPYRVEFIHRNEVYWDWYAKAEDKQDSRWMLRRKWAHVDSIISKFPGKKELIRVTGANWGDADELALLYSQTGSSTDLAQSIDIARGWSVEEQEWRDPNNKRVCLFQLDLLKTEQKEIIKLRNGRTAELDLNNAMHIIGIVNGIATIEKANVEYIERRIYCGPHVLKKERLEFSRYPIVGAFGREEDRTKVPYGSARWLMYLQDEVNARVSKMQWLLGSVWTKRTKGAVLMEDEIFRQMAARPDADFILDREHMALPGATFEIDHNNDLNQHQYQRLMDLRETVKAISGVSAALSGDGGPDTSSGLSQMIEQSVQSLATLNDNFEYARMQVGELLLGMIIRDIGKEQTKVTIKGDALKDSEIIELNTPAIDPSTGMHYLTNDVQRAMLKVVLEDVPSTPAFREQQLVSMTEVMKSSDQQYKNIMMPYFIKLTNMEDRDDIIKAIIEAQKQENMTPERLQEVIKEEVEKAKVSWMVEQKNRELDIKERKTDAEITKIINEAVGKAIEAIYSGTQAAQVIASTPQIAPVADQVLNSAGFIDQDESPIVANGPIVPPPATQQNTSPMFPPRANAPAIEEEKPQLPQPPSAVEGAGHGIESQNY